MEGRWGRDPLSGKPVKQMTVTTEMKRLLWIISILDLWTPHGPANQMIRVTNIAQRHKKC